MKGHNLSAEDWTDTRTDDADWMEKFDPDELASIFESLQQEELLTQFNENLTQDQKDAISKWSMEASSYTKEQLEEKKVSLTESILGERDEKINGYVYDSLQENIDEILANNKEVEKGRVA